MRHEELPPILGGRYRPERVLGRGGMGMVYLVEHVRTGQKLALKLLAMQSGPTPELVERFRREAQTSSRIQSDHVVLVTDADIAPELDGAPFLVMELLKGQSFEHAVDGGSVEPKDAIDWLRQVARGLGKAHERGIVHRDLKPGNLFLARRDDGSYTVKILDFGIAKMVADGVTMTQPGRVMGTPLFMAPEQALAGDEPITPQTDLFALGLISFWLLVGRTYWRESPLTQLFAQVVFEPIVPPSTRGSTFGPAFDQWFMRACHREPAKRFPSAYEQVEALAEALGFPHAAASADSGAPRLAEPSVPDAPTLRWSKAGSEGTEGEPGTTTGARGSLSAPSSSQAPLRRRVVIAVILVVFLLSGTTVWLRRTPAPPPATDGSARDAGDAAVSE